MENRSSTMTSPNYSSSYQILQSQTPGATGTMNAGAGASGQIGPKPQPHSYLNSVHNCEMDSFVKIKIGSLDGRVKRPDFTQLLENPILQYSGLVQNGTKADLCVSLQVWSDNEPITLPVSSSYKSFTTRWNWNEWILLPIRFNDLPQNSLLCITIYDCGGPSAQIPVGGTTVSLFGKNGLFRHGLLDLKVWPGQVGDGHWPPATPGKGHKGSKMYDLTKLTKKYRQGQLAKLDWLDRLTFSEIETICENEKRESDFMFLNVEFPLAEWNGVQYNIGFLDELDMLKTLPIFDEETQWIPDHEIFLDNLVELKHHTLFRCIRSGFPDKELKPNALVRDKLKSIVNYPPTKSLSGEEQDLVWKFRYYLSSNKKALAKFLKCVKWELPNEEKEGLELLWKWVPMDVQDALELLGPSFTHPVVRSYAVERLKQAPDDDLLLYLLQLVQALKYENFEHGNQQIGGAGTNSNPKDEQSTSVMDSGPLIDLTPSPTRSLSSSNLPSTLDSSLITSTRHSSDDLFKLTSSNTNEKMDLASFLIYRACENTVLVNYFYWYLFIECEDNEVGVKPEPQVREMYGNVMRRFIKCLKRGKYEWQSRRDLLSRQQKLINKLVDVVTKVTKENGNRLRKIEKLQSLLEENSSLVKFDQALPFPLDPEIQITGILPKEATLFKSSQMPCKLTFMTELGDPYIVIFKHGDDLRQDQLVLQIITLMDKLLRKENLDLQLLPYRVLATSTTTGFVQYIDSYPVAEVLATEQTIQNFFRKHHPSENDLYGISRDVMSTYVKSCAAYSVITYLLGIGDRHLDNLLLTKKGNLFHIDFGYILGRDPKPMPPPMKLSKEMVDAMGGLNSEYYQEFRNLCYTTFLHLRRHANLILNLFSLMVGASVPDIALEPDKTVKKVLDKFQLELNDEAAVKYMQEVIDVSVTAVMPALLEQMHKFTQMLRK